MRAEIVQLEHDANPASFEEEVLWHDSYVAEQHVHHYGKSARPVCWSLVGYASGYASACLGQGDLLPRDVSAWRRAQRTCTSSERTRRAGATELETLRADFQGGRSWPGGRATARRRAQAAARTWTAASGCVAKRERELNLLRERVARHAAAKQFIAGSAAMQDVLELAARVAPLDTTVLVYGESGTGKEFIVRMIHDQSPRAGGPFVSHQLRGADRNAAGVRAVRARARGVHGRRARQGRPVRGRQRTARCSWTKSARLRRRFRRSFCARCRSARSGAWRPNARIKVNARVVAATNRDLRAAVAAGTFREDLYFRLGAFVITVPPLRDRREDIPPLVHDFVRRAARRVKKDVQAVSADAMTALMSYRWPGNVRELEHAIERAVIVARGASHQTSRVASGDLTEGAPACVGRQSRPAGTGTRDDRARARAFSRQSEAGGRGAQNQHRDALAEDEAGPVSSRSGTRSLGIKTGNGQSAHNASDRRYTSHRLAVNVRVPAPDQSLLNTVSRLRRCRRVRC